MQVYSNCSEYTRLGQAKSYSWCKNIFSVWLCLQNKYNKIKIHFFWYYNAVVSCGLQGRSYSILKCKLNNKQAIKCFVYSLIFFYYYFFLKH